MHEVIHGDCLQVLATLPENSVEAIVTDPPYGLSFMGKNWDHGIPGEAFWREALRVAKPGAHLLAFGGTRTFHRLAVAIEDAGWEIRDCVMWVYGSGFPKSRNIGKAVDQLQGNERAYLGPNPANRPYNLTTGETSTGWKSPSRPDKDKGTSGWDGWGTALKPAWEPVIVARKPLEGTVADNVLKFGTGGLNIDGCRVGTANRDDYGRSATRADGTMNPGIWGQGKGFSQKPHSQDRWPANLIHDGSEEVVGLFPQQKSPAPYARSTDDPTGYRSLTGTIRKKGDIVPGFGDSGSAARFFYVAKASKRDRDEGVAGVACVAGVGALRDGGRESAPRKNHHPTVKPTALMRYLCRLVTPPGGTVLDPFCGSGSTGKAAILEGFNFIGIEQDAEYAEIARARIAHAQAQPKLML